MEGMLGSKKGMLGSKEGMLGSKEGMPGFHTQDRRDRLVHDSVVAEGPYRARQMLQHIGSHIHPDEGDLNLGQPGSMREANVPVHPAGYLETVSVDMVEVENTVWESCDYHDRCLRRRYPRRGGLSRQYLCIRRCGDQMSKVRLHRRCVNVQKVVEFVEGV
jgi:hypothetical protein